MYPSNLGGSGRGNQGTHLSYRRHDPVTIARLEQMFRECRYPDETRRREISVELGIDENQVKYWFQNKKIKQKTISERMDNKALRLENERMQSENLKMRETLQNAFCVPCGGLPLGAYRRELELQTLRAENILLTQECERITKLLANYGINPMRVVAPSSSHDTLGGSLLNQTIGIRAQNQLISAQNHHIPSSSNQRTPIFHRHVATQNQLIHPQNHHIPPSHQHTHIFYHHIAAPGQHITIPDHGLNKDIPAIDRNIPGLHQANPHCMSSPDCYIPDLSTVLDQNIPIVVSDDENNNIPVVEEKNQDTPPLGGDISALDPDMFPIDLYVEEFLGISNNDVPHPTMGSTDVDAATRSNELNTGNP